MGECSHITEASTTVAKQLMKTHVDSKEMVERWRAKY